jgi:DNA-binding transcriptional ArsR family regulator
VIDVPMTASDVQRIRFAYSPLAEVAESLYMLATGRTQALHAGWYTAVRGDLRRVDMALLRAVVPPRPAIADFLFAGATDTGTTIEQQLQVLGELAPADLRRDLEEVWQPGPLPTLARELTAPGGPRRLADALGQYWSVAVEPHWRPMRGVLDDDVAHRVTQLTKRGIGAMLAGLHPSVTVSGEALQINVTLSSTQHLSEAGLLLVPSVFAWPNAIYAVSRGGPSTLTYAARGVGNVWWSADGDAITGDDSLGALLGRNRAAILTCAALPLSTTELALKLGQSPASVSQHLAVLRRSGLVTSWRAGRSVLYRRTALADSIVAATIARSLADDA